MRLLQLNPTGDEAEALDLHPMATVVTSLSPSGRDEVVRAAMALPFGQDPGYPGLLEAHGILLDLTTDMLRLLDLRGGADLIVRAADLPAAASILPPAVEPLSAEQFLEITPVGEYPELDALRTRQGQALEALDLLREALAKAKQGLEDAQVVRRKAELALEAAQGGGRPNLRLVTAEYEAAAGGETVLVDPRKQIEARQREILVLIGRLDRGIAELAGVDVRPLQVLLDAIHNPGTGEMAPSERGQFLADEFVRLQSEVARLEQSLDARGLGSNAAMTRLDAARWELNEAEKAMRPPEFTDQDRADLESAHDEVIESERKARGRGGRKRLEEAIEREQAILDRMGFPTWSAYVMGSTLMGIDPAAEQRLERARFEYEASEQHWSNVAAMIEADPVHGQLLDQLEAVYLDGYQLLGGDDAQADLEACLRAHLEPKRDVSIDELVDALAYQLELVGMGLPVEAATLDRVVLVAEAFLEEAAAIQDRIRELSRQKVEALTELQTLEEEWERLEAEAEAAAQAETPLDVDARDDTDTDTETETETDDTDDTDDADADDVDVDGTDDDADGPEPDPDDVEPPAAEAEHGDEGDEASDPDEPEIDLSALEAALTAAREHEHEYDEFVEARESLVDAATQIETVAAGRLHKAAATLAQQVADDATEQARTEAQQDVPFGSDLLAGQDVTAVDEYLAGRVAALRAFSYAGSLPLIIDDALTGQSPEVIEHVLDGLDALSDGVQIVYLSDDPTVAAWAERVGFQRAAVVRAPQAFA